MRIAKLKWSIEGHVLECGPYKIVYDENEWQMRLYYRTELLKIYEILYRSTKETKEMLRYLKQAALDHANKLLEEKCS